MLAESSTEKERVETELEEECTASSELEDNVGLVHFHTRRRGERLHESRKWEKSGIASALETLASRRLSNLSSAPLLPTKMVMQQPPLLLA